MNLVRAICTPFKYKYILHLKRYFGQYIFLFSCKPHNNAKIISLPLDLFLL